MTSLLFDIRHKDRDVVLSLASPVKLSSDAASVAWEYRDQGLVVDVAARTVYQLQLDAGEVLQELLRKPLELPPALRLLLRRQGCREHVVHLLRRALKEHTGCAELSEGFQVLNGSYRKVIEALSTRCGKQSTVSLQELELQIMDQSVLSEKDMVTLVFHPYFMETQGLEATSEPPESFTLEAWALPLGLKCSEKPMGRTPYVLSLVIAYLRSLLGLQILPHKILQCFVFDLCVYFRRAHASTPRNEGFSSRKRSLSGGNAVDFADLNQISLCIFSMILSFSGHLSR